MHITIYGAGVVGTATGKAFIAYGTDVTFVDVIAEKVQILRDHGFDAVHPDDVCLSGTNAVFISVPTPSENGRQNTRFLVEATISIAQALRHISDSDYPVIVFRCTQVPGMTAKLTKCLEQVSGKKAEVNFGVVYNPEYLRAENPTPDKNPLADSMNPLVITLGHDDGNERSVQIMEELYAPFRARIDYMSVTAAEFQKYVHNVFNAIKISAFNELRLLGEALGLDDREIDHVFSVSTLSCEGLRNPRYGTRNMGPYNGACLPKEVIAMMALAQDLGINMPVVEATHEVNEYLKHVDSVALAR